MLNTILESIRKNLRINHETLDSEIEELIRACLKDLELSGVASSILPNLDGETGKVDPLIKRAITIYCKANFGYDNPDYEKLNESYQSLKNHLSLSTEYNTESEESV